MKRPWDIHHLAVCVCIVLCAIASACSPSRSGGSTNSQEAIRPLNYKEYIPSITEFKVPASGAPEGRIYRDTPAFKTKLARNVNADIEFKDEENTGADQFMTQRCNDRLSRLAIMVMNHWSEENVKLRVVEAWDEDGRHPDENSLHYEGRAVDITTSDIDQSKYGMLARLAVEAGFDWVYYESKAFIHASVKSDDTPAAQHGGCFPSDSEVTLVSGETKHIIDLKIGDSVKAIDEEGDIIFSDVIMMMDSKPDQNTRFYTVQTVSHSITLTAEHIIYAADINSSFSQSRATFASNVHEGQYLFSIVHDANKEHLVSERITGVRVTERTGAFAPLTYAGTIIVDNVAASSYAVIEDVYIAHAVFTPVRWFYSIKKQLWGSFESQTQTDVHWYPHLLYTYGRHFVSNVIYPGGIHV